MASATRSTKLRLSTGVSFVPVAEVGLSLIFACSSVSLREFLGERHKRFPEYLIYAQTSFPVISPIAWADPAAPHTIV